MKNKTAVKGFTLIELLIVIALLGALAIGLLATIDPFEQLKKGRDTATRNTATEFYNANLRYYGTKGNFPWTTDIDIPINLANASAGNAVSSLVAAGELKTNFSQAAGTNRLGRIYLTSTTTDEMVVCFTPESKNFRLDSNTIYSTDGDAAASAGCIANGGTGANATSCFWCIK